MCNFVYSRGKIAQDEAREADWDFFRTLLRADGDSGDDERRDASPTDQIKVLRFRDGKYRTDWLRFGLIPRWYDPARAEAKARRMGVNTQARSETVLEKPSFSDSFRQRRCLVVISGFYEWRGEGKHKQKCLIFREDGHPLLIAAIWDRWTNPETGEVIEGVAMLTTEATEWMMTYQDRQPLFLEDHEGPLWCEGSLAEAQSLLRVSEIRMKADAVRHKDALF